MNPRALVTGGAGFIGSHLVDNLSQRGYLVRVLDLLSTGTIANLDAVRHGDGFELIEASVLDHDAVARAIEGVDVVFHLAAAVGVRLVMERPREAMMLNVRGTEIVLEAALRQGATVLITSSSEVYGKPVNDAPFREDSDRLLGPVKKLRWSYSLAKAVDETLAFCYHQEFSLPTVVVRLFNVTGPRQSPRHGMVLPRFIEQAQRDEPLTVYGDGQQTRTFTYVGDAVEAMVRLSQTETATGEDFNVAGSDEVTVAQLAQMVIEQSGSRSEIVQVPMATVFGSDFEEPSRRRADTSKLLAHTGYRCETPLSDIIARMLRTGQP